MSTAFPFNSGKPGGKLQPSPFTVAPRADPFRERAEREAQKKAERPARPDPFAAKAKPKAVPPAKLVAPRHDPDPFARPSRPSKSGPSKPRPPKPPRVVAKAPAPSRTLANGAELQLVSSKPAAKPKPKPAQKPVVVEEEKQSGKLVRAAGGPALWVAGPDSAAATAVPMKASANTPPAKPAPSGEGKTSAEYWGVGDRKSGGKGGGGKGGGGKSGDPPRERTFDQDDFAGIVIAIMLLLLLGWMWLQGLTNTGGADDSTPVSPQAAATKPAPLPDPFGRGPVDLRPTSPIPEPAPEPAPVETAQLTPKAIVPPPPAAEPAPAPTTLASPAVSRSCSAEKMLRAYFCTAKSNLAPAARVAFRKQVAELKSCGGEQELVVTGYADTRGTAEFNSQLGELRADFMADILRAEGFTVVEAVGIGELTGIEDNRDCANQRRVDIAFKSEATASPSKACLPPEDAVPLACS